MIIRPLIAFSIISMIVVSSAQACPKIDGLIDVNCDGKLKIVFTGDSITRGVLDEDLNRLTGGYVLDLQKHFPNSEVINLGVPGKTSAGLLLAFKKFLPTKGKTYKALEDADYLQLEVGTNDFWKNRTQIEVVRFIISLRDYLKKFSKKNYKSVPFIFVASLPPTNRPLQKPYIRSVNKYLLTKTNKAKLPVLTRFDTLPTSILSYDNLHPDSDGYRIMARLVRDTLKKVVQSKVAKFATDRDKDGIADRFEIPLFGTNPALSDTNGNGILDGVEVFGERVQLPQ